MKLFDQKLGADFILTVPTGPGVYRVYNEQLQIVYIGKAKNLRRRLGQYRNAKRRKKHRKMRKILEDAASIEYQTCPTELDAEILESQLIQEHRPKWNVAGAFFFLYPMIGMKQNAGSTFFCYTTHPEHFQDFTFHGAYRSRFTTREAFFALIKLLRYVGHPIPKIKKASMDIPKYSYVYGFRNIPVEWNPFWEAFWKGENRTLLENLILSLIENAGARLKGDEIQKNLNLLSRFWKVEAVPLFKARTYTRYPYYPVTQRDRDLIFLRYRRQQESSIQWVGGIQGGKN